MAASRREVPRAEQGAAPGAHPERRRLQWRPGAGGHLPHGRHHRRDTDRLRGRRARHERGGQGMTSETRADAPGIYRRLGVKRVIHGAGTTTRYGGSILRPEALEAMREASQVLVNIDELN